MSSLHLNMLTPRLNRTTGTFDKCRLSHGLGVGTCEQRFSGRGAQRRKPDQRLHSPAVTHHPTAVWRTLATAAFAKPCRGSGHWLVTFFLFSEIPLKIQMSFSPEKHTYNKKTLPCDFQVCKSPLIPLRLHWKVLKKGISFFFSQILSYGGNNNSENGKDYMVLYRIKDYSHVVPFKQKGHKSWQKANSENTRSLTAMRLLPPHPYEKVQDRSEYPS